MNPVFRDRVDAGRQLAARLERYANQPDVIVLALPRGGVPVAAEVAERLQAPLDVFVVRKLGAPGHEELAMGAIASGGVRVINEDVVRGLGIPWPVIAMVTRREESELARREALYRGARPALDVRNKTVILVDDGLATGASMRAAVGALSARAPARLIVAVPVGAPESCAALAHDVDDVVCAVVPLSLGGVGAWYDDFSQTSDDEVRELIAQADGRTKRAA